ncbi:MAG: chemotaxis protein CheW [Oligoflexia bacterium]|nr:MAG: chemotaxis protein CheW [Oligoflexia bacterium]
MKSQVDKPNAGQYLSFQMKGQTYGFPISAVQEINRMAEITPVPQTHKSVLGVMNLRGKVIPVIDLSLQLGMGQVENTKNTCIIVTESPQGPIGVVVDIVKSVMDIHGDNIETPPVISQYGESDYVMGLAKVDSLVIILVDIVKILSQESLTDVLTRSKGAA